MTIAAWLKASMGQLGGAGIATARLDCLVLLEDQLDSDRAWILAHPEHTLQRSELEKLNTKIVQRADHIPLAYIRGRAEFYGREFIVNEHTLVPRPETETMIEMLKTLNLAARTTVLDVGTGSGCIAITAALEIPSVIVRACDIDNKCLTIAKQNATELLADKRVNFYADDLLVRAKSCDVILANLPYVPDSYHINTAATHEPRHAIFGGADGLDQFKRMFEQLNQKDWRPSYILTESLPPSHDALARVAKVAGYQLEATDDFIQRFKKA
jgi:release factor glutamine methyltransferase